MPYSIAAIDIHKKVLMVVIATGSDTVDDPAGQPLEFVRRRFGTSHSERQHLVAWLQQHNVREVVMESTAQYWRPIWLDLEPHIEKLHLAHAQSNRAPKGRKNDFADAQRLARRLLAGELILSFVPEAEQRSWRSLTRGRQQLIRDRQRLHSQVEALLEETRIKLSSVISDLFGASGRRILAAVASGETEPAKLAQLGDDRLRASKEELADALTGNVSEVQRALLTMHLERLALLDRHIDRQHEMVAGLLKKHEQAVLRLAVIPGLGPDSAQQIIAEVGHDADAFPTANQFCSWIGVCPGSNESAEQNHSTRSPKGNKYLRRLLNQAAQSAVKKKGCHFQNVFRRLIPQLGYKAAIWAIAHRLAKVIWKVLHDGVDYIECGTQTTPKAAKRALQHHLKEIRRLGYDVQLTPKTLILGDTTS